MKNIKNIIKKAIDIHVHIGPEMIPRKYTAQALFDTEDGNLGGAFLKNHFYPTQPFVNEIKKHGKIKLFGGIVLNNTIGGLSPDAIYASSIISKLPIMVWFPTIHAANFLRQSEFEIAPEWVNKKNFAARKAKEIIPVDIMINGKISDKTFVVLQTIKQCNAILATGHLSWKEAEVLISEALIVGIKRIVITHPLYQKIAMPIKVQKKLAERGCFIEQSYSMYSIDKIPIKTIAKQIKVVGYQSIILSSDVGQAFSLSPSQALYDFARLLYLEGINEKELFTMLVTNPKKLLSNV